MTDAVSRPSSSRRALGRSRIILWSTKSVSLRYYAHTFIPCPGGALYLRKSHGDWEEVNRAAEPIPASHVGRNPGQIRLYICRFAWRAPLALFPVGLDPHETQTLLDSRDSMCKLMCGLTERLYYIVHLPFLPMSSSAQPQLSARPKLDNLTHRTK